MPEALWGVLIGGFFTLFGSISAQIIMNANKKHIRRREEVFPVAAQALRAARLTWISSAMHSANIEEADHTDEGDESRRDYLATGLEYLKKTAEHYSDLEVTLEELSLFLPEIEPESQQLLKALQPGVFGPEPVSEHEQDLAGKEYSAARRALKDKVRRLLRTHREGKIRPDPKRSQLKL